MTVDSRFSAFAGEVVSVAPVILGKIAATDSDSCASAEATPPGKSGGSSAMPEGASSASDEREMEPHTGKAGGRAPLCSWPDFEALRRLAVNPGVIGPFDGEGREIFLCVSCYIQLLPVSMLSESQGKRFRMVFGSACLLRFASMESNPFQKRCSVAGKKLMKLCSNTPAAYLTSKM